LRPTTPFPQPGNLSAEGEGRLFFESQDALLPQDVNGTIQDIYQWEPEGVGSCEGEGGCLRLISSGAAPDDSLFVDSTPSGDDAFFITRERLLPRDKDSQLDLYDARVGGGLVEPKEEPCSGEACPGPIPPPPPQPSAASQGFAGPGNLAPRRSSRCAKGKVGRRGRCVSKRKAKRQRQRRAAADRRAQR
jgi:hypothetical protein